MADHSQRFDCIVLAGDRRSGDPLANAAGVRGKALVPVGGLPMLHHVLKMLNDWPLLGRLILVAPERDEYREIVSKTLPDERAAELRWISPRQSLVASVTSALERCQIAPSLLLTADHVLLDQAWLEQLIRQGSRPGTAIAVGLTDWQAVMARFPGSRRTRYRFSDLNVCGTNLFLLNERDGVDRVLKIWRQVEEKRKKPWRIVSLLGYRNLGLYLARKLSVGDAFEALSEKAGAGLDAVLIQDPLAAVDVDSPEDLELVERVLRERRSPAC